MLPANTKRKFLWYVLHIGIITDFSYNFHLLRLHVSPDSPQSREVDTNERDVVTFRHCEYRCQISGLWNSCGTQGPEVLTCILDVRPCNTFNILFTNLFFCLDVLLMLLFYFPRAYINRLWRLSQWCELRNTVYIVNVEQVLKILPYTGITRKRDASDIQRYKRTKGIQTGRVKSTLKKMSE